MKPYGWIIFWNKRLQRWEQFGMNAIYTRNTGLEEAKKIVNKMFEKRNLAPRDICIGVRYQ